MLRNRRALSACLLAIAALAVTACSDQADSPTLTAPAATTLNAAVSKPRRAPYISNLQLGSIYVSMGGGIATPFTVTVTNPSSKDYTGILLQGELKSQNNQPPTPATGFVAYCPLANGTVPPGACTMSGGITGGVGLSPGPGTFTLRLVQRQADELLVQLDSKTVDVVLSPNDSY